MKIFLIIIACIQNATTPLDKSCIIIPMKETFETVPQCLSFVDYFRYEVQSADPSTYITGFCTSKEAAII